MKKKLIVITCPKCGKEYLPSEIFIPKTFFGVPKYIERDEYGKILSVRGNDMDTNESYRCDSCDTKFDISTKISFESTMNSEVDFSNDYSKKIFSGITLKEF